MKGIPDNARLVHGSKVYEYARHGNDVIESHNGQETRYEFNKPELANAFMEKAMRKLVREGYSMARQNPTRRNIRKKASTMDIKMVQLDPIESELIEEIIMSDHASDGYGLAGYLYPDSTQVDNIKGKWLPKYQKAMKSLEKKGIASFQKQDKEVEKEYPGIRWGVIADEYQEETGEGFDHTSKAPRSSGGYTVRNLVFATGDYYTQNNWEIDTWDGLRVAKKTMNFESRTPLRVSRMDNVMKALLDIPAGRAFTRYWFDPIKHQIEVIVLANVDDTSVAEFVDARIAESNGEIRRNGSGCGCGAYRRNGKGCGCGSMPRKNAIMPITVKYLNKEITCDQCGNTDWGGHRGAGLGYTGAKKMGTIWPIANINLKMTV